MTAIPADADRAEGAATHHMLGKAFWSVAGGLVVALVLRSTDDTKSLLQEQAAQKAELRILRNDLDRGRAEAREDAKVMLQRLDQLRDDLARVRGRAHVGD